MDGASQRIEALKIRRKNERTKLILSACSKGDLESLKQALKVLEISAHLTFDNRVD